MIKLYIYILLIFVSCKNDSSQDRFSIYDGIIGTWVQNETLYKKEVKNNPSVKHMGNLSEAFGEIKMIINIDSTYQSYFDNQINNGKWKIEDEIFYMTPYNDNDTWIPFKYKLNKGELYIYSEPWLMALSRE